MNTGLRLLLLPLLALGLITACADESTTPDATGFSNNDRFEAQLRHEVLPGMPASLVVKLWGPPQDKKATSEGETWIYNSGPAGGGYDVHTTVKLSQGKVTDVQNGDVMAAKWQ